MTGIRPTTFSVFIPPYVDWLCESREECPPYVSLSITNMSIMMSATMLMEGTLEYVFRRAIRRELRLDAFAIIPETSLQTRVLTQVDEDIRRVAGWDGYKKMYKLLFGEAFKIDDDLEQSIAVLFKLRGAVIGHGRAVNSIGPIHSGKFEWESETFDKIEKYLVSKALKDKMEFDNPDPGDWFSDKVANHFYQKVIEFLVELGLKPEIDANLLWYDEAPRTAKIVSNRLGGRANSSNR